MPYQVLTEMPARHIYMVTGCSTRDPMSCRIDAIKVVRHMCQGASGETGHPLYGLKPAKDFIDAIENRVKISTTLIIEMEEGDYWRHRGIIGAALATMGYHTIRL